jgi:hypothetical protein
MASGPLHPLNDGRPRVRKASPTWTFTLERVTGIEPALSAWEAVPSGPVTWPDLRGEVSASDRERPLVTEVNGPLMAQRSPGMTCVSRSRLISADAVNPTALAARVVVAWIGSSRTHVPDRSSLDATARW